MQLAGFKILEKIHENNHSDVYRAIREVDQLAVILKTLKADYPTLKELSEYQQEYRLLKTINIKGITKVYGIESYQRSLVIILEDFGGISLNSYLQQQAKQRLSINVFLEVAIAIVKILIEVHQAKIIHKDINPANIVIHPVTREIKLIDFGIASQLNQEKTSVKNINLIEGTLAYLAPEQTGRINRFLDYRADFYALGVTFYELLTGTLPFNTADPLEMVHFHLAKVPHPPHELVREIPEIISNIITILMAKIPEARYQSMVGLFADLEQCWDQWRTQGSIIPFPLQQADHSCKFEIPQKLYGRDGEIEQLRQAFERVQAGNKQLMLVSGYSGIGKSSLVNEIEDQVSQQRGIFVRGKFDQLQRNIPYLPIINALRELLLQILSETEQSIQQWRSQLSNALGDSPYYLGRNIPELGLILEREITPLDLEHDTIQFDFLLQKLVQVFAQAAHPLVIFLDDLQWADNASLKFIEVLASSSSIHHIFLIGAYRDNEIDPAHPLMRTLKNLESDHIPINQLKINNLTLEDVNQLIADTLKTSVDRTLSLAEICYQKTHGNPFFLNQLLISLSDDQLIFFDEEVQQWQWQTAQLNQLQISDNVVELILIKLRHLPPELQHILSLAATIGNFFDLATLILIDGRSTNQIATQLQQAIAQSLIISVDNHYKIPLLLAAEVIDPNLKIEYCFSHDRIQQAAYSLMSPIDQQQAHFYLGKALLGDMDPSTLGHQLFDIVNHLNWAISCIVEQTDLEQLIQLNLLAAQQAKQTAAFNTAFHYMQTAIELLEAHQLSFEHPFILQLYQQAVEIANLSLNFSQMNSWAEIALHNAHDLLDQGKIYEIQIQAYIAQNQLTEAINTAFKILEKLEIDIPSVVTESDITQAIATTTQHLKQQSIVDLEHLPKITDPKILAVMRILSNVSSACYISRPELYPLVVLKQVNLSVEYGNADNSAYAYATYGLILCATEVDIEFGNQMGTLALNLLTCWQAFSLKAKVFNLVYPFIYVWQQHLRQSLTPLLEGYYAGVDHGDLEFAAYCLYNYCSFNYFVGNPLPQVAETMQRYGEAIAKLKQQTALNFHHLYWQSVLNLMGDATDPSQLVGAVYDETKMLAIHQASNDQYSMAAYYINKLILNYLFQQYAAAMEISQTAKQYIEASKGYPFYALYFFYDSLTQLALYHNSTTQAQILNQVKQNQIKLKNWAYHAPMNYQHKYDLVAAEVARVTGDLWQASELYEQAIAGANKQEYCQEEALAYELAAKFYRHLGRRKIAQNYLIEAHYLYRYWGAIAKVEHLEQRYPQFLPRKLSENALTQTIISSNGTQTNILDLNSIFKVAQALTTALKRETLLNTMMKIIIENAGAEKGYLILSHHGIWRVEASAEVGQPHPQLNTCHLEEVLEKKLPATLINYVIRTQKDVVLNQATNKGDFTTDPYICQARPQSILCLPLIHQGKMNGVLYLENRLTTDAFTPDRLEILQLLSTQAAISLENVNLYETLEEKVSDRTAELTRTLENLKQTQNQLIEAEKMASLGNLVAGVAHEISTPVGTSITISSFLAQETENFLTAVNTGQLKRSVLNQYLQVAQESSQMLLANLTRAGELVNSFKQVAVDQNRLEHRTFNVKTYLEEIVLSLQPELRHQQHRIYITGDDQVTMTSYPGALSQIITNLVMNSINHAYPNQRSGTLSFQIEKQDQQLKLIYCDDGCGIAADHLNKIFEPFFTTARNQGGTGLGLHIVYNLVHQTLKGTISCQSAINQGTQFFMTFPLSLLDKFKDTH